MARLTWSLLKVWEGALDLVAFLAAVDGQTVPATVNGERALSILLRGARVLELGCGAALPACFALQRGAACATVQDYNDEPLRVLAGRNVHANAPDAAASGRVRYVAGDWGGRAADVLGAGCYDIALTAETLYSPATQPRLLALLRACLCRPDGIALVAAKSYYFGVGGSVHGFRHLVAATGDMRSRVVASVRDGASNVREILLLSFI